MSIKRSALRGNSGRDIGRNPKTDLERSGLPSAFFGVFDFIMAARKNYEGLVIGKISFGPCVKKDEKFYHIAKCKCGEEWLMAINKIPKSKGLGCRHCTIKASAKHGFSGSKIYKVWAGMKERCSNPNAKYFHCYGGRGISVCKEWLLPDAFIKWALETGYTEGLTLERNNVNGNYCPENCRWATLMEQGANQRKNVNFEINGVTKHISQWCREYNVASMGAVRYRIKRGMSIIEALTTPISPFYLKGKIKQQSN